MEEFERRAAKLRRRMADAGIDLALLTDPDSIYYVTAHWGDLGLEYGRPTIACVARDEPPVLITAEMEREMASTLTWIEDVRGYRDGDRGEWREPLGDVLARRPGAIVAVERHRLPAVIAERLRGELPAPLADVTPLLDAIRRVKSPGEIAHIRQAGEVAVAMGAAAREAIAEDVPEYEVSLAAMAAGTRRAAEILAAEDPDGDNAMTPMIHNLPVVNSGRYTSQVHRHPTVRRLRRGDPIYLCFCTTARFKQLKLGFDREYFVGEVTDEQARLYEAVLAAQRAAVAAIRPGVTAEDVHRAAVEVYREHGLGDAYRTGRALGCSALEKPELKEGDRTPLEPGMVFSVDGGITVPERFGARVGDTILVIADGHECVTEFPRDLEVL